MTAKPMMDRSIPFLLGFSFVWYSMVAVFVAAVGTFIVAARVSICAQTSQSSLTAQAHK